MEILYTAEATAYGGREGRVTSSDDHLDVEVGIPKELGGAADNAATNPEQLLAAGYAACFQNAMIRVARKMKLDASASTVTCKVGLGQVSEVGFGLDIELHASLPNLEREQAAQLLEVAHQVCPFSNAMRGNVEVRRIVA